MPSPRFAPLLGAALLSVSCAGASRQLDLLEVATMRPGPDGTVETRSRIRMDKDSVFVDRVDLSAGHKPTRALELHDYASGSIWLSESGGPYRRRGMDEIAYEEEIRLRRASMAFRRFARSREGIARSDLGLYFGDLRVERGTAMASIAGLDAREVRLAAEPGASWKVLAANDPRFLGEPAARERFLLAMAGASSRRARSILDALGGVPLQVFARYLKVDGGDSTEEARLVSWRRVGSNEEPPPAQLPSPLEEARAKQTDDKLRDPALVLRLLRSLDAGGDAPLYVTPLGLCLRLSRPLRAGLEDAVCELVRTAHDSLIQVEGARSLLRHDARLARDCLRPVLLGSEGLRAMNVVEALAAERSPFTVASIFHLVLHRQQYADVAHDDLVAWALEHLGAAVDRPVMDSDRVAWGDLAHELDGWLRWWELARSSYPPL